MFSRVTRLKHAQIEILQIVACLVLDINTWELTSSTRLELEPWFFDTWLGSF